MVVHLWRIGSEKYTGQEVLARITAHIKELYDAGDPAAWGDRNPADRPIGRQIYDFPFTNVREEGKIRGPEATITICGAKHLAPVIDAYLAACSPDITVRYAGEALTGLLTFRSGRIPNTYIANEISKSLIELRSRFTKVDNTLGISKERSQSHVQGEVQGDPLSTFNMKASLEQLVNSKGITIISNKIEFRPAPIADRVNPCAYVRRDPQANYSKESIKTPLRLISNG